MNLFTWLFGKSKKHLPKVRFPKNYLVTVSIHHPRVIGHLVRFKVSINASDKGHARRQVLEEMEIKVDKQVKTIR